jgi:hypothetical protein
LSVTVRQRPTKDLAAAVRRLHDAAPYLIVRNTNEHKYGGSIAADIAAVLIALEQAQAKVAP